MTSPLEIGITGGIGSGKSLACAIFSHLGIAVYDADDWAKKLMTTDKSLIEDIKKEFGILSYDSKENLNKEYLRKLFSHPNQLKKLNKLVHPRVSAHYLLWKKIQRSSLYIIKEAALLLEAGTSENLDKIITVFAPVSLRMKRTRARDSHRSKKEIRDIMHNQMDEREKMRCADYIILNDEKHLITPRIWALHKLFIAMRPT